jgi:hypothetical protein
MQKTIPIHNQYNDKIKLMALFENGIRFMASTTAAIPNM